MHGFDFCYVSSANALVMNDDCQTPLEVARAKGYSNVVNRGNFVFSHTWLESFETVKTLKEQKYLHNHL